MNIAFNISPNDLKKIRKHVLEKSFGSMPENIKVKLWFCTTLKEEEKMHKKIMSKAAKALEKDAAHYKKEAKQAKKAHKSKKAKHELVERREAVSAAKDLKKRAKKAHEY